MKRMHVHLSVGDIPAAVRFYSALFATQPSVVKPDYAKWMLDDPRVNLQFRRGAASPDSTILGFRSRAKMNCARSMGGCTKQVGT